jgi:hypothetical protein
MVKIGPGVPKLWHNFEIKDGDRWQLTTSWNLQKLFIK